MHGVAERGFVEWDVGDMGQVRTLLGGDAVLAQPTEGPLDVHDLILRGLPAQALTHLIQNLGAMRETDAIYAALGMSLRTYQRRQEDPSKPLNQDQGGRAWKFAEILTRATTVFGSQDEAEQWLERPAIGLAQRRPIDLLATPAGLALVEDHLTRLEYGVYA